MPFVVSEAILKRNGHIMKITAAFDSFKGSISSVEAGNAAADGIRRVFPDAEIIVRPMADGGEGTVSAVTAALGGSIVSAEVNDPLGNIISAEYGIAGDTAVMEMSAAAGLTLVPEALRDPMKASTYGVGMMIADAVCRGCRNFIIGIGGSATNDCGVGMLTALGFGFFDREGRIIRNGAVGLGDICRIDTENVLPQLGKCRFSIACDVTNPLCGENGCSYVYAPQKGASAEDIPVMDRNIRHFADIAEKCGFDSDIDYSGSGAAGGLGYAFRTFLGGELVHGAELIIRETKLEKYIEGSDFLLTGEGRTDNQTAMGKAPLAAAGLARKHNIPVIVLSGSVCGQCGEFDAVFSIANGAMSLEEAMDIENAKHNMADRAENIFRLIKKVGYHK